VPFTWTPGRLGISSHILSSDSKSLISSMKGFKTKSKPKSFKCLVLTTAKGKIFFYTNFQKEANFEWYSKNFQFCGFFYFTTKCVHHFKIVKKKSGTLQQISISLKKFYYKKGLYTCDMWWMGIQPFFSEKYFSNKIIIWKQPRESTTNTNILKLLLDLFWYSLPISIFTRTFSLQIFTVKCLSFLSCFQLFYAFNDI
jgi:hypothetical protein